MKYLIVTSRRQNPFGSRFCLFWGNGVDANGYTPDIRLAHRYSEEELPKAQFIKGGDFAVPCNLLGVSEENVATPINESYHALVEIPYVLAILRDAR